MDLYEYGGEKYTIKELASMAHCSYDAMRIRLHSGRTVEQCIYFNPKNKGNKGNDKLTVICHNHRYEVKVKSKEGKSILELCKK